MACSKSSNGPAVNTIIADIDGVTQTFNIKVGAQNLKGGAQQNTINQLLALTCRKFFREVIWD